MKHRIPSTNWLWRAFIPMMLIVMFLIPKTVLAENALSWETYAQKVRIHEEAEGIYADWDIADKQDLIESLIQMNAMSESAATRRLLEGDLSTESKHALADQIILRFLGGSSNALVRKDGVRAVRWNTLTNAIMGDPSTWTLEEKVGYQQLSNMFGHKDPDTLVLPTEEDLSEDEAIEIARRAITHAYGLQEDTLDGYLPGALLYITENDYGDYDPRPDYRRWNIQFLSYQYGDVTACNAYTAIVDENGHVIGDDELGIPHVQQQAIESKTRLDASTPAIVEIFRQYAESEGSFFAWQWTYEAKASYSHEIRSKVLTALESGKTSVLSNPSFCQEPVQEIINSTVFAYGLPQKEHLPIEEALSAAAFSVMENYGLSGDDLEEFSTYAAFDITNSQQPLWKFLYCPDSFEDMEDVMLYKIEMDAQSGETLAALSIDWDQLFLGTGYEQLLY